MASAVIPYLIDANVYLGLANAHDSFHDRATSTFKTLQRQRSMFILLDHVFKKS
jgi:predicted nucleic acid-binding protein